MKSIEVEGKNIEDALEKALNELNTTKEKINFEIIDPGAKGLFNVIGFKPARIRVSMKYDYIEEARKFIANILKCVGLTAEISITEKDDAININLYGKKMGLIIGYRGETLDSIQYLLSLVVNKSHDIPHKKVILDTENYRSKREETLKGVAIKSANRVAYKVRKSGKILKLEPMNPYERRIIHFALQDNNLVNTYSEGEEPFRRIVIEPNN